MRICFPKLELSGELVLDGEVILLLNWSKGGSGIG